MNNEASDASDADTASAELERSINHRASSVIKQLIDKKLMTCNPVTIT